MLITPLPLVRKSSEGLRQVVELTLSSDQEDLESFRPEIQVIGNGEVKDWPGSMWSHMDVEETSRSVLRSRIDVPAVSDENSMGKTANFSLTVLGRADEPLLKQEFAVAPYRQWEIHVVAHSHCDVGFTHPASEVAEIHNKNLDLALAAIRATEHWPEEARFRWTIENSWQLENYRKSRSPSLIKRVIEEAEAGRIEVTACYLHNHFDILGANQLHRITWEAEWWRRQGIRVDTAMLSDIPGVTWGIIPVLRAAGVQYLAMAPNNFSAPFHQFAPPDRPFYWAEPGGERLLVWYTGDPYWAYIEGARYGLLEDVKTVAEKLPDLLIDLEESYPFPYLMLQVAFDNDRFQISPALVVQEWNSVYAWPRLRTALPSDFFRRIEEEYGSELPVVKGDWPSWWVTSTTAYPREAAASRRAHRDLAIVESLATLADSVNEAYAYPHDRIGQAYRDLLTFDEHSGLGGIWIAFSQHKQVQALEEGKAFLSRPMGELPILMKEVLDALAEKIPYIDEPTVAAINPGLSKGSGLILLESPMPQEYLEDDNSWQRVGSYYLGYVDHVPALSYRSIPITKDKMSEVKGVVTTEVLSNEFYEIRLGRNTPLEGIKDLATGRELVAPNDWPFAGIIAYREDRSGQELPGGDFQARKDLYEGVSSQGSIVSILPPKGVELDSEILTSGFVTTVVRRRLTCDELDVSWDIWLYHQAKRIDLSVTLHHKSQTDKHHIYYLALPFARSCSHVRHEIPGGWTDPGSKGQLPGSCMDVYAVGDWIRLSEEGVDDIVLSSRDAALVEYDGIHFNKFLRGEWKPKTGLLMFRLAYGGGWEGDLAFRFSLTSGKRISDVAAHDFAQQVYKPLIGVPLTKKGKTQNEWHPHPDGFVRSSNDNVVISHLFRLEEPGAYLIWLKELSGEVAHTELSFPNHLMVNLTHSTPAGHDLGPVKDGRKLVLRPYETLVLKAILLR